jgi:hypothetical protein
VSENEREAKESAHDRARARARARESEKHGERASERARERERERARARARARERVRVPGWQQPRQGENRQRHRPLWRKQRLAAPPPTRFWPPLVTPEVGLAPPGFRVWSLGFEHGVGFKLSVTPEVGLAPPGCRDWVFEFSLRFQAVSDDRRRLGFRVHKT